MAFQINALAMNAQLKTTNLYGISEADDKRLRQNQQPGSDHPGQMCFKPIKNYQNLFNQCGTKRSIYSFKENQT